MPQSHRTIEDLKVLHSDFHNPGFEEVAVDAVAQWRHELATLNGRPERVCLTVVIDFAPMRLGHRFPWRPGA